MKSTIFVLLASSLLSILHASPLAEHKRQACAKASSCATYSGTSIWWVDMSGTACPTVTLPASVQLAVATPAAHPESCYYPTLDYCAMGQYTNLMLPMSSIATAIYNAQTSGAVVCGATKTANLPVVAAHTPTVTAAAR